MRAYKPPKVCMRCGGTTRGALDVKTYRWSPEYVSFGLLGHLIHLFLVVSQTEWFKVPVPHCDRCNVRLATLQRRMLLGIPVLLLLAGASIWLLATSQPQTTPRHLGVVLLVATCAA